MRRGLLLLLGTNAVLWAGTARVLLLPLFRPRERRGDFLWGHYSLEEVYVGVPLLLLASTALLLLLCPRRSRRTVGVRAGGLLVSVLGAVLVFDLAYAFGLVGAWRANYWLDLGHVSRLDNVPDDELGFTRRPNLSWKGSIPGSDHVVEYRTDSRGFRNPTEVERAEVAFLGDSYTEAAQIDVEHTFAQLVAQRTGRSVVNLGRGAYGPPQELIVLRREGLRYAPRFLVWQIFEGNDLSDAQNFAVWRDDPDPPSVSLRTRYLNNSFFQMWLVRTLRTRQGDFARLLCPDGTEIPLQLRYAWSTTLLEDRARGWSETRQALRDGVALCRENGIEPVVLFVPVFARVHAKRLRFDDPAQRRRHLPDDLDSTAGFASALPALCAELGVPMLDVFERFSREAEQDPRGIYIPTDEHLDRRGHAIVADLVVEWLGSR